jgi:hypothetical protein
MRSGPVNRLEKRGEWSIMDKTRLLEFVRILFEVRQYSWQKQTSAAHGADAGRLLAAARPG